MPDLGPFMMKTVPYASSFDENFLIIAKLTSYFQHFRPWCGKICNYQEFLLSYSEELLSNIPKFLSSFLLSCSRGPTSAICPFVVLLYHCGHINVWTRHIFQSSDNLLYV